MRDDPAGDSVPSPINRSTQAPSACPARPTADFAMLEVMTESHEDPREQQADAGGRSESGSNTESPDSQESAPDPRTIIKQRTPVTSAVLSKSPPERETLASVRSQVCEDPIEIDAAIKEIGAPLIILSRALNIAHRLALILKLSL